MSGTLTTIDRLIAAPPEIVAKAIASPHALGTWLCDDAVVEKRPGGRLLLTWRDGRIAIGRWTTFEAPGHLAWRVTDEDGANASEVRFKLTPAEGGTHVSMSATGAAEAPRPDRARFWANALDDLRVLAETGRDNRMLRRPIIGINLEFIDAEMAKARGLPVERGILVTGTVPDGGAAKAGITKGDILVAIGDKPLDDWPAIASALDAHSAGDTVVVTYYRGNERADVTVALTARPAPQSPEGSAAILAALKPATQDWISALEAALDGVTEEQASARPGPDEWTIKEVLGHLSGAERFGHDWLSRLATDSRPQVWPEDHGKYWRDAVASFSVRDLLARVVSDLRESEALSSAVLAADPAPWVARPISEGIAFTGEHIEEHIGQIRGNLGR